MDELAGRRWHRIAQRGRINRQVTRISELHFTIIGSNRNQLVTGINDSRHRRVELNAAILKAHTQQRRLCIGQQRLAKGFANQRRGLGKVDLIAIKVEEFGIDQRETGLQTRLHGEPGDQVIGQDGLHFGAPDQFGDLLIFAFTQRSNDMIGRRAPLGVVDQRQNRLDHFGVRLGDLGRQDNHRTGAMGVDNLQIGQINGAATAADDTRIVGVAYFITQLIFHLDLVFVAENGDHRVLAAGIRYRQFRDNRKNLGAPAEDDGVIIFDHKGTAFAQLFQARFNATGDDPNQDTHEEEANQRHAKHGQAKDPGTLITGNRPGIQRMHGARPDDFGQRIVTAGHLHRDNA